MQTSRRLPSLGALISVALGASALMAAAAPAAVLPPGQVVFSSDRPSAGIAVPAADGSDARIWISSSPLGSPLAAPVQVTFGPAGLIQHRNPDWSSDRAKIAFAVGVPVASDNPATVPAEIRILDLATRIARPFVASAAGQDYPAFSPDGTKVAFVAGGTLLVKPADALSADPAQVMADDVAPSKPSWSPDGRELYFTRATAVGREIWKAAPGAATRVGAASADPAAEGIDNYDPAVSPDGTALCYSRTLPDRDVPQLAKLDLGTGARTAIVTSSEPTTVGGDTFEADESCAWSPDAENVIFTATPGFPATRQGTASDLHLASVGTGALANPSLTGFNDVARFDGAADWAPDLSPRCESETADVVAGGSVTIPLSCVDPDSGAAGQAPATAPLDASALSIVNAPGSGRIDGGVRADGTVAFVAGAVAGTVTFTYTGTDGGSSAAPATVTVNVSGGTGGPGPGPGGVLRISGLKLSPTTWALGRSLPTFRGADPRAIRGRLVRGRCVPQTRGNRTARACVRLAVGTTISFGASQPASVAIGFQRVLPGRRVGGRCVAPTRRNRRAARCVRFAKTQSLAPRNVSAGIVRLHFFGRLSPTKRLVKGATYRVVLVAQDNAGHRLPRIAGPRFTIAKRSFTVAKRR
jgi:hypothetical protein